MASFLVVVFGSAIWWPKPTDSRIRYEGILSENNIGQIGSVELELGRENFVSGKVTLRQSQETFYVSPLESEFDGHKALLVLRNQSQTKDFKLQGLLNATPSLVEGTLTRDPNGNRYHYNVSMESTQKGNF
jgi:hypothetical protein